MILVWKISSVTANQKQVTIYRIVLKIENGMSSTMDFEHATIRLDGWVLQDVKFVDDSEIVLAMSDGGERRSELVSF